MPYDTLLTFKNNKSPDNDGLTSEFYKSFWDTISNDLINVLMILKSLDLSLIHKNTQ